MGLPPLTRYQVKRISMYIICCILVAFLASCASTSTRKTADYYRQNEQAIKEIRKLYDTLYRQQPFASGFTDKSCKYYVLQVMTDTLRYIFDTEHNERKLYETVLRFQYDTAMLRQLAMKMKTLKCLWLARAPVYSETKSDTVEYLSFKSVSVDKPFEENKYYVLIFLDHQIVSPEAEARVRKGDLVKIDELVYFTIGSKYR